MYQLTIGSNAVQLATLGDVLVALNDRCYGDPIPALDTISLTRDGQPMEVVCNKYNKFGVTQPGNAMEIFQSMLSEVEHAYMKPAGVVLMPYQVTKQQWDAVQAIADTVEYSTPCFTADQRQQLSNIERNGKTLSLDLYGLRNHLFPLRLGYGYQGPALDEEEYKDTRHENHVGYALAAGKVVPGHVLADCLERENARKIRTTGRGEWYAALLRFPVLRGAMSVETLRSFCYALERGGVELSEDNVDVLVEVMRRMPARAESYTQVEDLLYLSSVLKPREVPVPPPFLPELAYSDLALRLVEEVQAYRVKIRTKYFDEQRAKGKLSQRDYEYEVACVKAADLNELLKFQNGTARAVADRHVATLLKFLDVSDDQNPATKRALEKHVGLKLKGLKAAARRTAIFEFCGYGPEQRTAWEAEQNAEIERKQAKRDAEEALSRAERARWRTSKNGEVISGKEYVDRAVQEGKTEVVSYPKGKALQYYLKNPADGSMRNILAKDGTLGYARSVIANLLPAAVPA